MSVATLTGDVAGDNLVPRPSKLLILLSEQVRLKREGLGSRLYGDRDLSYIRTYVRQALGPNAPCACANGAESAIF